MHRAFAADLPRIIWFGFVALLLLMSSLWPTRPTVAQGGPNRVGLVVQFAPGSYMTRCVEFSEPQISGYDVLSMAGLDLIADSGSSLGVAICSINEVGCDFPADDCFCQCQGVECVYWSYWHLKDGQWEYSQLGAGNYFVRNGDVEGWNWGPGTLNQMAEQPPLFTFEQLCAPPTPTPTLTPTPTATPILLEINFYADNMEINAGACTRLRWNVRGAQALYLDGQSVASSGDQQVCPADTAVYRLQIVHTLGDQERLVRVTVRQQTTPIPTPTVTPTGPFTPPPTWTPTPILAPQTVIPTQIPIPSPSSEDRLTPFEEPTSTPFVAPTPTPEAFLPASLMPTLTSAPQTLAPEQPATPTSVARVNQNDRRESERGQEPVLSQPLRRVEGTRPGVVRLLAFGLVGIVSAVILGAISLKLWQRQP